MWYFGLLQELIFWLKVCQKAGICIQNFKIFRVKVAAIFSGNVVGVLGLHVSAATR